VNNLTPKEKLVLAPLMRIHDTIYRKSGGRLGHHPPGRPPCLILHTIGAKTAQRRSGTLTYAKDGDSYLIVASNLGNDKYPGWYYNVRKRPECEINVGSKRFPVTARMIASDDADYGRLWEIVNLNNANRYNGYQSRTSRPIPIFTLTPV
jgi:deazaflavin-dependent oxidoreductase (nitroreductase family)